MKKKEIVKHFCEIKTFYFEWTRYFNFYIVLLKKMFRWFKNENILKRIRKAQKENRYRKR